MVTFKNEQAEDVVLVCDGLEYRLIGNSSMDVDLNNGSWFTVKHSRFLDNGQSFFEKTIGKIAKGVVLIIDTSYTVEQVSPNAEIRIKNGVYEYRTGDFGYLFFDVLTLGCKCSVKGCKSVNEKEALKMQKLLRTENAMDFPPFTTIVSYIKYRKIKKLCNNKTVLDYIKKRHI